jgi:hypothetical protein
VVGVPDAEAAALLAQNVGPNFGSVWIDGLALWHERDSIVGPELLDFFEQLLQFDAALVNGDRQARKSNVLWRGATAYAIDHALALSVHAWDLGAEAQHKMLPEANVREHVAFRLLGNRGCRFDSIVSQWQGILTSANLATLRGWVPVGWEHEAGHIDRIFAYLGMCAGRADHVSQELRRVVR